jgi:DNA-binding NarL/FixJ family response regulator
MPEIKVAIVEDNHSLRQALRSLLEMSSDFTCVGEYDSCVQITGFSAYELPEVILMDVDLPGESGISCTRRIKDKYPFVNVLILTVIEVSDKIIEAINAGASGYLLKSASPEQILDSIRVIHKGGSPLTPSIARKIFESLHDKQGAKGKDKVQLNKRETEVLNGLVLGLSYKMIADKYFISIDTVRSYIRSIYEKMEVHSRSEAIVKALKDKLV